MQFFFVIILSIILEFFIFALIILLFNLIFMVMHKSFCYDDAKKFSLELYQNLCCVLPNENIIHLSRYSHCFIVSFVITGKDDCLSLIKRIELEYPLAFIAKCYQRHFKCYFVSVYFYIEL